MYIPKITEASHGAYKHGKYMPSENITRTLYRSKKARRVMSVIFCFVVALNVALPNTALSAIHHVRAGAGGTGTDWNYALGQLPSSLQRGDTYYIADGTYSNYTFNDPEDGTQYIYIKKATETDHGSDVGWLSSYGNGVAEFTGSGNIFTITTDNWVLDGQTGGGPGSWDSGFGFKLQTTTANSKLIMLGQYGISRPRNIVIKHIEMEHRGLFMDTSDDGIYVNADLNGGPEDVNISYCYLHDCSRTLLLTRNVNNWLFEYNYVARNSSTAAVHGGGWAPGGCDNMVVRYNLFEDIEGTAFLDLKKNDARWANDNWDIYGNIFCYTPGYTPGSAGIGGGGVVGDSSTGLSGSTFAFHNNGASPDTITTSGSITFTQGATSGPAYLRFDPGYKVRVIGSASNDGTYTIANVASNTLTLSAGDSLTDEGEGANISIGTGYTDGINIYNNTFVNIKGLNSGIIFTLGNNNKAYNNIWYNCSVNLISFTNVEHDYNWFAENYRYGSGDPIPLYPGSGAFLMGDPEDNQQVVTGSPFVDWQNGDFKLTSATEAGLNLSAPFNTDMFGATRGADGNWDRGACEYGQGDTITLTITANNGSVTKTPDKSSYDLDEDVTLQAVPNSGYSFTGWSGDLSGSTNPVTIGMDSDKSVTAGFVSDDNIYHVNSDGSGDFTTISSFAQVAQPGDTCLIHAGTYSESSSIRPQSGTSATPITFQPAGDGEVIIAASGYGFNLDGRDYVVIEGLTFSTYGAETCIRINNANYNKVLNCKFLDFPSAAYKDSIEIMRNSNYNLIQGNTFGSVNHNNIFIQGRESGVFATHNIVRNNVFNSPEHRCLGIHQTSRTLVENNTFRGTADQFIQFEGPDTILRKNLFYDYVDYDTSREQDGAIRLWAADADYYGNPVIAQHNRIYNNVFYNNEKVHGNHGTLGPNPVTDNIFKNNIYYQNQETVDLDFPDYQTVNQNYFFNNAIYGTSAGQVVIVLDGDTYTVSSAESSIPGIYNGNLDEDPLFVNADNADFSLQQNSPAIDAGADLTHTTSAGTGTVISVEDALYLMDGWGVIDGDMIKVGSNSPVRITNVDYGNNLITVESSISWNNGDSVNLPYSGNSPDMGAVEYSQSGTIIAGHSSVAEYDQIPQNYIDEVKSMLLNYPGESHSRALVYGLELLEQQDSKFAVNSTWLGAPESPTVQHLRIFKAHWTSSKWESTAGEEDTYTNQAAIDRMNSHIAYCKNTLNNNIDAYAFGWCWDMTWHNVAGGGVDPVYNVRWAGASVGGPDGDLRWGLDDGDTALTGNSVNMQTYLDALNYYAQNNSDTTIIYSTGPVDGGGNTGERGYQRYLKNEFIRDWVNNGNRFLFDYADIITHNNAGEQNTTTWDSHTFTYIHPDNVGTYDGGDGDCHISQEACIRLAKAMWVLLAKKAGWEAASDESYSINISTNGNGSVTKTPDKSSYNLGEEVTLQAVPNAGHSFINWSGDLSGSSNPATIIMNSNKSVTANFTINTYTITASTGSGGQISPIGNTQVSSGSSQAYTISASGGYHIADVLVDGSSVGAVGSYTFTNVTANHTIAASFAVNTFTIVASAGSGGQISPSGSTQVVSGGSQIYTITANTGYHITDVLVDGGSVGAVSSYTFTSITANHTIAATFVVNTHTITASTGSGGQISPSGITQVNEGTSQTYTITADAGYHVANVLVDGGSVGAVSGYTFTNVTGNHTISASFDIDETDETAPTVTNLSPQADDIQAPLNTLVTLRINDPGEGVDADSVTIRVNNNLVYSGNTAKYSSAYGECHRTGTEADYSFIYQSNEMFDFDQLVSVAVNAADLAGNVMAEYSYSFRTEMRSFGKNIIVDSDDLTKGGSVTVRDSSGDIWVAWHAGTTGNNDIYVNKLTAGSGAFGNSIKLTDSTLDQRNPAFAVGSDDKLYVAWQDSRNGNWDIYVSTSTDGVNWSAETRVTDSNDNQMNPAIVVDNSLPNKVYVAWEDGRNGNQDIYIGASNNEFVSTTVSQITSDLSYQGEPAIAVDSDNTVYVVWTDKRITGINDIYGAASNSGPWTNIPIVTEDESQSSPMIATEAAGSILHLVWVDDRSGENDIYYAQTNGGLPGSPLTGSSIIDDTTSADQLWPVITVDGSTTDSNLHVFACWQDERGTDDDLYFVEISSGNGTNVFVGDDGTNTDQTEPAIGMDGYGQPYLVWTNDKLDIYYAGSTFVEPDVLASGNISTSSTVTVGTALNAIDSIEDVSIEVPQGAYPCDIKITISKVQNSQEFDFDRFGGPYEFGPSGIDFIIPVTITIPYEVAGSETISYTAYWYNPLTNSLSQQGITDIETVVISSTLHALRFKTSHFSQFLIGGSSSSYSGGGGGGGGGGGCSMSPDSQASAAELLMPYLGLTIAMIILKLRDRRKRKACNIT